MPITSNCYTELKSLLTNNINNDSGKDIDGFHFYKTWFPKNNEILPLVLGNHRIIV